MDSEESSAAHESRQTTAMNEGVPVIQPGVLEEYVKVFQEVMDFKDTVKKILIEIGLGSVCEPGLSTLKSDVKIPEPDQRNEQIMDQVRQLTVVIVSTLKAVADIINNIFSGNVELPSLPQLSSSQRGVSGQVFPKTESVDGANPDSYHLIPLAPSGGGHEQDAVQSALDLLIESSTSQKMYVDAVGAVDDVGDDMDNSGRIDDSGFEVSTQDDTDKKNVSVARRGRDVGSRNDTEPKFEGSHQGSTDNKPRPVARRGRRGGASQRQGLVNGKGRAGLATEKVSIYRSSRGRAVRNSVSRQRVSSDSSMTEREQVKTEDKISSDEEQVEDEGQDEIEFDGSLSQEQSSSQTGNNKKQRRGYQRKKKLPGKNLDCEFCPMSFKTKRKFEVHLQHDHPEHAQQSEHLAVKCGKCEKVLTSVFALRNHMRTHSGPAWYGCSQCSLSFKTYRELKCHTVKAHDGAKNHLCSWCGKAFTFACGLTGHIRLVHVRDRPHHCEECGARFLYRSRLIEHKNTVHSKQLQFACEYCGARFFYPYQLKKHKKRHHADGPVERPYKCEQCPMGFFSPSELKLHRRSHTKERPFRCTVCGAGFAGSTGLNRHLRIHAGIKNQTCQICGKAFRDAWTLKNHTQTVHSGEKPFQCEICQVKFGHKNSYRSHMKRHKASETAEGPEKKTNLGNTVTDDLSRAVLQIPLP